MALSSSPPKLLLLPLFLLAVVGSASSHDHSTALKEKMTHLHFYFHEIFGTGPNATAMPVVISPVANSSSTSFGQINVIDDMLREGPEPSSKLIGRAQGLAARASLEAQGMVTALNFAFTEGEYSGSSIAILGRVMFTDPVFERSIVGGTGKFRMARGYTLMKILTPSPSPDYLLAEVDAYILHLEDLESLVSV